jgi:hypothetical protein
MATASHRSHHVDVIPQAYDALRAVFADLTTGRFYPGRMCRNITTLRGLEPEATAEEIEAAARQFVRKVSGVQSASPTTHAAFEKAVRAIASATTELLSELPARRQPPPTLPSMRRGARAAS